MTEELELEEEVNETDEFCVLLFLFSRYLARYDKGSLEVLAGDDDFIRYFTGDEFQEWFVREGGRWRDISYENN